MRSYSIRMKLGTIRVFMPDIEMNRSYKINTEALRAGKIWRPRMAVYEYSINDRLLKTGDVISTKDGINSIYSLGFRALGALIPGEVDHSVLYVGPGGLCVEAGMFGVITFSATDTWDSKEMFAERGLLDTFMAASSVLAGRGLSSEEEYAAREFVRAYALGCVGKPYNLDFLHPDNERAMYCSQLVYLAYKKVGIDLNIGTSGVTGKWCDIIIFPQEIYENSTVLLEN